MGKTKELTDAAHHRRFGAKRLFSNLKDECGCGFVFIPLTSFLDRKLWKNSDTRIRRHLMRHYVFCACSCNQTATTQPENRRTMIIENLIDSYVSQGASAYQQGQFQAAGRLFLAAYQKSRSLNKSDPKLAVVYANLSLFYYQQKRYRKAEGLLEQSLAILTENGLLQSDFAEKVRVQLANVYLAQNKHVQLLKHYKTSLSYFLSVSRLADSSAAYNRIIDLYVALDRMKDAEIWCRQALAFDSEYLAKSDPIAKKRLIKMAWIYTRLGKTDEACRIYQHSVNQEREQTAFIRPAFNSGAV